MSKIFFFAIFLVILTWLLLIIGGLVNPMGASLACPDWYFIPTCNGEFLPKMTDGVLYEHGHRLMASLVGFCTLLFTIWCWCLEEVDRSTRRMSLLALFLVILQGTLGGITVLLNLSLVVSTLHLLCAMIFFGLLITISFRLSPAKKLYFILDRSQAAIFIAICFTFIQMLVGGLVRHMGAGLACGDDLIGCGPTFWPSWFYGQLHMGHRILGYILFFVVLYSCLKVRKEVKDDKNIRMLSLIPVMITFCQLILGLLAIHTIRNPSILALHTGFAGLLLASLLTIYCLSYNRSESLKLAR